MQEQRPSKRFRSTAANQGVHPQETGCPGAEGGDPGGAAGPPQPGQPSRPFAYVNPMRREAPAFVDPARLAQRGRGHRRGASQGAERGRGRDPRLHRDPRLQEGPGRLLGPGLHLELDSGEVPEQPAGPEARETPFTRAAMAAAAHGHVLRNPGPGSDTLRMGPQGPPSAYGFWGLREVQPSACSYVGFVPSGSALIVMQTPSGTYLYSVTAPYAHHSQPLSL